jgi:outer membrane protein assembly factor BamB
MGILSGASWVDYSNDRLYFTTRRRAGGSSNTVWSIDFDGASASLLWSFDAGEIDGNIGLWNNRVYFGDNDGRVHGRDATTGSPLWTFDSDDGPIKNGTVIDRPGQRLFFSTTNRVWSLSFAGDTGALQWSSTTVPGPSSPVLPPGGFLYVGGSNGQFYEFDIGTGAASGTQLGDGTAVIGRPSFDGTTLYVGSDSGAVYAVTPPF